MRPGGDLDVSLICSSFPVVADASQNSLVFSVFSVRFLFVNTEMHTCSPKDKCQAAVDPLASHQVPCVLSIVLLRLLMPVSDL